MKKNNKLDLNSIDVKEVQKAKLKQLFPEVFNKEKVDFEKLKLSLGENIDTGRERYGMNWPGKAQAIKVAQLPSDATLKPDEKASVDFDTTQNLFIEGDNLEVLKLLQKSYFGKIKMCYIDPPYNTGKEFIYPDKYEEGLQTYLQYTGQIDAEGKKFSTNVEADGRFHSKWMDMMWPRLFLARNLLTDDGVIFISIGDDEVSNLIHILNEIFGEENKVGICSRLMKSGSNQGKFFSKNIDYVLVYAKNIDCLGEFREKISDELISKVYTQIEKDGAKKGNKYRTMGLYQSSLEERINQRFWIKCPDGSLCIPPGESMPEAKVEGDKVIPSAGEGVWRWTYGRYSEEFLKGNIEFKETKNSPLLDENGGNSKWNIYTKIWLEDRLEDGKIPVDLITKFENRHSSKEIQKMGIPFDFAKPIGLIKFLIEIIDSKNDDIVLDFFAGSGTTAHSVMQLNAEDGVNRKFILVQLPEVISVDSEAYKAGYKYITEIGEERIRKAGKMVLEENRGTEGFDEKKFDNGFKVFKLDKSNFSVWDGNIDGDIQKKLELHVNNTDLKSKEVDILYEILIKSGFELSERVEEIKIDGKKVYSVSDGQLLICLDKTLDKDFVRSLAEKKPKQFICLNSSFKEDADLTNTAKILENNQIEFRTI